MVTTWPTHVVDFKGRRDQAMTISLILILLVANDTEFKGEVRMYNIVKCGHTSLLMD
mgnify:CR=1 FL=1